MIFSKGERRPVLLTSELLRRRKHLHLTGVRFPVGAGNFSLRHHVQTGSAAHPLSYRMGNGVSFYGVKETGA